MTKEKKLTKKDKFAMLLELEDVKSNQLLTDFIKKEIELLNKKNSNSKDHPTDSQLLNAKIEKLIIENLKPSQFMRIAEIIKIITPFIDEDVILSSSRMSSVLRKMMKENRIERKCEKKIATFALLK